MLELYDLAGRDETVRFSPFCWRTRLALEYKGLPFKTVPWRFTEKEMIAFSGQGLVPVLRDGENVVADSWLIADYIDSAYPRMPTLFPDRKSKALTKFVNEWTNAVLNPAIRAIILPDIVPLLHEKDVAYFVESRERRFGIKIEDYLTRRADYLGNLAVCLAPLRALLARQCYLSGECPSYADHIVASAFIWAKICCSERLWDEGDVIGRWFERFSREASRALSDVQFRW